MAKKKTKKRNNGFFVTLLVFVAIIGSFLFVNRYEFFPRLIKDGVEVHFLTKNGEDKVVVYPYNSGTQSRFNYAITDSSCSSAVTFSTTGFISGFFMPVPAGIS